MYLQGSSVQSQSIGDLQKFRLNTLVLHSNPWQALKLLQAAAYHWPDDWQLAPSAQFWHQFAQVLRHYIRSDQYAPVWVESTQHQQGTPSWTWTSPQ